MAEDRIIHENSKYRVVVGNSQLDDNMKSLVYKIVNIEYGVVEDETVRYPQAMYIAGHMEAEVKREGWVAAIMQENEAKSSIATPKRGVPLKPVS